MHTSNSAQPAPDPRAVIKAIVSLDNAAIASMLSEAAMAASNARANYDSKKSFLTIRHMSPDRVTSEIARLEKTIADENKRHAAARRTMDSSLELYKRGSLVAANEVSAARTDAIETQQIYAALTVIAKAKSLTDNIDNDLLNAIPEE